MADRQSCLVGHSSVVGKGNSERQQSWRVEVGLYVTEGAMMNHLPASPLSEDAMREADRVVQGYTVSFRGRCMTRIGGGFVMRGGARRCVRVPVTATDALALGGMWAEFSRPANEMGD